MEPFPQLLRRELLPRVRRPYRYLGSEPGSAHKAEAPGQVRIALAVPELYEAAQGWPAPRALYASLNAREDAAAERAFAPDDDMAALLRAQGFPLFRIESGAPVAASDLVCLFVPGVEAFTTALDLLDLSGMPVRSADRADPHPLVVAFGPARSSPEPFAPFVDAFAIGDAEAFVGDLVHLARQRAQPLAARRAAAAQRPGLYVPGADGARVVPRRADLASVSPAAPPPVPYGEVPGDRFVVEISRDGVPVRSFPKEAVLRAAVDGLRATGHSELSLSAAPGDGLSSLADLLETLAFLLRRSCVALSLAGPAHAPLPAAAAAALVGGRRARFEIGLSGVGPAERVLSGQPADAAWAVAAAAAAFSAGADGLRLRVTLGVAGHPAEQVEPLLPLLASLREAGRRILGRPPQLTVALRGFVPERGTPLAWARAPSREALRAGIAALRKRGRCAVRAESVERWLLRAAFARGSRALADVVERAWRNGARLDGHPERFAWGAWERAFSDCGRDPDALAGEAADEDAPLPWHALEEDGDREALRAEWSRRRAAAAAPEPDAPAAEAPVVPFRAPARAPAAAHTLRVRYGKHGDARFIGHLDLMELFVRSLRRAGLPLAFSQGDEARPKVAFGQPLPLLYESEAEWADVGLSLPVPPAAFRAQLDAALPAGIACVEARYAAPGAMSLMAGVAVAEYRVSGLRAPASEVASAIARFEGAASVRVPHGSKSGVKEVELKRMVRAVRAQEGDPPELALTLSLADGGVRLSEALSGIFGIAPDDQRWLRVTRTGQWAERGGERREPWG